LDNVLGTDGAGGLVDDEDNPDDDVLNGNVLVQRRKGQIPEQWVPLPRNLKHQHGGKADREGERPTASVIAGSGLDDDRDSQGFEMENTDEDDAAGHSVDDDDVTGQVMTIAHDLSVAEIS
jgi:hypothetical protein